MDRAGRRAALLTSVPDSTVLCRVLAKVPDNAGGAVRLARDAHVAAVQDEPMVGVQLELIRNEFQETQLDFQGVLAGCDVGAVRYPEDVRIDGNRRLAECDVQHHVRRFSPDARQCLQCFPRAGHLTPVFENDAAARLQHVLRLHPIEADRLDVALQPLLSERNDLGGGACTLEELARREVHALVGRLRGQDDRDEQLERRLVLELGLRCRVRFTETTEDLVAFCRIHSSGRCEGWERDAIIASCPSMGRRWRRQCAHRFVFARVYGTGVT